MKKLLTLALCALCVSTAGCTQVNGEDAYIDPVTKTEVEKVNPTVQELIKKIDTVMNNNAFFELVDGVDSSVVYSYNKYGEVFAQSTSNGYTTIMRNDGKSVNFTDRVAIGTDIDVLSLLKRALIIVEQGYATLEKLEDSAQIEQIEGIDRYYIRVKGFDNLKQLYMDKGEEYANSMIENMKNTLKNDQSIVDIDSVIDKFETEFQIITNDEGGFGAECRVRIGDSSFTSWNMFGYLSLYDWKLPNEWYTYDFKNAEKSEEMLVALVKQIDKMITDWANDTDAKKAAEK